MRQGTYSIVARDPDSAELGVGVHSHWFSVGSLVSWARPGVGAVATQSIVEPAYGPEALERLAGGVDAEAALGALVTADPLARLRQVGIVDARGRAVAHTGADCIVHAGHEIGDGFACQANMMAADTVPQAMAAAFEAAQGDLPARLVAALHGAETVGGDVRGRQSAALLVVPADGPAWKARMDLRVDDHPDPLSELARLLGLQRAYELADEADELMGAGRTTDARELYRRAADLAPGSDELEFWAGLALAQGGDLEAGAAAVGHAAAENPGWRILLGRLSPEMAPAAAEVRRALGWD